LLTTGSIPENRTQAHDATPIARRIRGGNLARKSMAHEENNKWLMDRSLVFRVSGI